jgi:anthranilate phosphoribosyltransferase
MLTAAEAKEVLVNISNGSYNPSQISAFFDRLHDAASALKNFLVLEMLYWNCVYVLIYRTITQLIYGTGGDEKTLLIFLL